MEAHIPLRMTRYMHRQSDNLKLIAILLIFPETIETVVLIKSCSAHVATVCPTKGHSIRQDWNGMRSCWVCQQKLHRRRNWKAGCLFGYFWKYFGIELGENVVLSFGDSTKLFRDNDKIPPVFYSLVQAVIFSVNFIYDSTIWLKSLCNDGLGL